MLKRTIACPSCKSGIPVTLDETRHKVTGISKYCPSCGIQIYKRCPKCNCPFSKLTRFCPECGTEVHVVRMQEPFCTPKAAGRLSRLRQDAVDLAKFLRELLLVYVRLNPPNLAAYRFCEIIASINDNTPRLQIVSIVEEALNEAPGVLDTDAVEEWRRNIGIMATELVSNTRKALDESLPDWPACISHPWIENPGVHGQRVARYLKRQLSQTSTICPSSGKSIHKFAISSLAIERSCREAAFGNT